MMSVKTETLVIGKRVEEGLYLFRESKKAAPNIWCLGAEAVTLKG